MDDATTDVLPTKPSAETPASGASDAPELEELLEAETAEEGQVEGADDELEDWEEEGKTYKVPKALKPRLMQQADYTRKTMEIAEQRKADEAARKDFAEEQKFHRENVAAIAKITTLDEQLAAFRAITAEQWAGMDAEKVTRLQTKFNLLKDQRETAVGELRQKQAQKAHETQLATAKRLEESMTRIAKEIPGWSDELAGKLTAYGMENGFTIEEIEDMRFRPQAVKALHRSYLYDQLVAKQRARAKTATAADTPAPTPVPKVGARRNPSSALPQDSDSAEVWMEKRNRQLKARG